MHVSQERLNALLANGCRIASQKPAAAPQRPAEAATDATDATAPFIILAIDPGTTQSAYVVYDATSRRPIESAKVMNSDLLRRLRAGDFPARDLLAIEKIASYGMPVGAEVFETCVWIGRFIQAAGETNPMMVYRREVKIELCGSMKAKDANVRQALIDRVGPIGTKKQPGPCYGFAADRWAALGVAVTAAEKIKTMRPKDSTPKDF